VFPPSIYAPAALGQTRNAIPLAFPDAQINCIRGSLAKALAAKPPKP